MIGKRRLVTGFAVLVLVVMYVLPFIVYEDPYGEVPIPGSATLHLPPGEVDLTLRSVGSPEGQPVPPLSIQISGPDGLLQPEVTESRRTKYCTAEDMWVRLWVVDVVQEADYHIEIEGEVYGPYQPWLTLRHMGNDFLGVLVLVGAVLSSLVFSVAIVVGIAVLVATLCGLCAGAIGRMPHRCRPEPPP
jgi:ABC-type dipeptide/oligopeptide/nickel transport system permease subunit